MSEKYRNCFYYEMGNMEQIEEGHVHFCAPDGAKTVGDRWKMKKEIDPEMCETCGRYKSRFIEYPITVTGLELRKPEPWNVSLEPVRVKPCGEDRTYFGVYLGEFPRYMCASFNEETGKLKVSTATNPCIFVPELGKTLFGDESWWGRIKPGDNIDDITDETIRSQWYMRMLEQIGGAK